MKTTVTFAKPEPEEEVVVTIVMGENDYVTLMKVLGYISVNKMSELTYSKVSDTEYRSLIDNLFHPNLQELKARGKM